MAPSACGGVCCHARPEEHHRGGEKRQGQNPCQPGSVWRRAVASTGCGERGARHGAPALRRQVTGAAPRRRGRARQSRPAHPCDGSCGCHQRRTQGCQAPWPFWNTRHARSTPGPLDGLSRRKALEGHAAAWSRADTCTLRSSPGWAGGPSLVTSARVIRSRAGGKDRCGAAWKHTGGTRVNPHTYHSGYAL